VSDTGRQSRVTVVIGVDGAGRSHRLAQLAAAAGAHAVRLARPSPAGLQELLGRENAVALVDDVDRLDGETLTALADAALSGLSVVVTRRPTLDRPELAALDDALAGQGDVEHLRPLDEAGVASLIADRTGRTPSASEAAIALADTAGLPALVVATTGDPDALATRVQRRLALLPPPAAQVARALAVAADLDLDDDALATTAGCDPGALPGALRSLRDAGLTDRGDRLIPVVARALAATLTAAETRRLLDTAAAALVAARGDVVTAAGRLHAAGLRTATAAQVYRAAGDRLRFSDPRTALTWYDEAVDAGADPAGCAAGRAEAAVLLGEPVDVLADDDAGPGPDADGDSATRLALTRGVAAAQQGRPERVAEALAAAGPAGRAMATVALVATGTPPTDPAGIASGPVPGWLRRFAAGAAAATEPAAALPLLIEAAEDLEAGPPAVLVDTPHALGALVAVANADTPTAERLLVRAIDTGVGGPALAQRHRLLLAWVRMRAGRYDTATARTRETPDASTTTSGSHREHLILTALRAGLARRSGDVAALRDCWPAVQEHLARRAVDLFTVELVEELAVAAARLRYGHRAAELLDAIDRAVASLGGPTAWAASAAWLRLQVAVAAEDTDRIADAAGALGLAHGGGHRQEALRQSGRHWADAFGGAVDPTAVLDATTALAEAELPWEASRLAGQAGIRTADPASARRLLERARELAGVEATTALTTGGTPQVPAGPAAAGLSDREVEVSRLVLAGRTHREIGAQLFIAPKTVEHHVARIRAKLGATTRAEFVASLRHVLGEPGDTEPPR
jgi:DNA-binding CsgD family transcriptional regulator